MLISARLCCSSAYITVKDAESGVKSIAASLYDVTLKVTVWSETRPALTFQPVTDSRRKRVSNVLLRSTHTGDADEIVKFRLCPVSIGSVTIHDCCKLFRLFKVPVDCRRLSPIPLIPSDAAKLNSFVASASAVRIEH